MTVLAGVARPATRLSGRAAIAAVLRSELRRDKGTILMGETVRNGGATGVAIGLYDEFGPKQVIETPVSENAIFGAALGLALSGLRPIVEIYSGDFLLAVANELMNDYAKWRQQHGRPRELPITVRGCMGANGGLGPEHSQCMEAYLHHAPGLMIVVPGSPADCAGLLRSAIRSSNPVIFLEHRRVYELLGDVPAADEFVVPLGEAEVVREGEDVTLVAWGWMRTEAELAAEELESRGISVELLDPRTVKPMDFNAIFRSVRKTRRLLVVEEAPLTGGVAAEVLARVAELDGYPTGVGRVTMPNVIHPYSAEMESQVIPHPADIIAAAERLCRA